MKNLSVYMLTLGCDKNTVDSEIILGKLVAAGLTITEEIGQADLVIVNTCCFINEAKLESIEAIFNCLDEKKEDACIIVTGCMAERYKDELTEEIPEIDGFFKLNEQDKILDFLDLKLKEEPERFISDKPYAYLKISDGCNRNCSYCAIPAIRGKYKSIMPEEILRQAEKLDKAGIQELILVAQDLTQYGIDLNDVNLSVLLENLARNFNFKWIRLLYLYPEGITDQLLDVINRNKNILPYFDIPIQHTNDRILKLMNRSINKDRIKSLVRKIRKEIDNAVIRSTVIVGFPSETEEEFSELLSDLNEIRFDRLGAFKYSQEENTSAYLMEPQISETVKEERFQRVNEMQTKIMATQNGKFQNSILECLIEKEIDKNTYIGRIFADAPEIDCITYVNSDKELRTGSFVPVTIREVLDFDLLADYTPK